jgi:hypothetical protein
MTEICLQIEVKLHRIMFNENSVNGSQITIYEGINIHTDMVKFIGTLLMPKSGDTFLSSIFLYHQYTFRRSNFSDHYQSKVPHIDMLL